MNTLVGKNVIFKTVAILYNPNGIISIVFFLFFEENNLPENGSWKSLKMNALCTKLTLHLAV
jgi:hypothetical protein